MNFPALRDAPTDDALKGGDVRVYLYLSIDVLDFNDWRVFKQVVVAKNLDIPQSTVSEALERLVTAGYLLRRQDEVRGAEYRLVYSRKSAPDLNTKANGAHG